MATISSIGIRIGVLIDDVDSKISYVNRRLGSVASLVDQFRGGFTNLRIGWNQFLDGIGMLRAAATPGFAALKDGVASSLALFLKLNATLRGNRFGGIESVADRFISGVAKVLPLLSGIFDPVVRKARLYGRILYHNFWADWSSAGLTTAIGNTVSSALFFARTIFQQNGPHIGRMFSVAFWQGWTSAFGARGVRALQQFFAGLPAIAQNAFTAISGAAQGLASVFMGLLNMTLGLTTIIGAALVFALLAAAAAVVVFVAGAAAFVGAVATISYSALQSTIAVYRMSREFATSFNTMQQILQDAARSGVQANSVERWLGHLEEVLGGVANGAFNAQRAVRLLGMDAAQLTRLDPGQAFVAIIAHLRQLPTQYERARVAAILFGRDFRRVLDVAANPNTTTPRQMQQYGLQLDSGQTSNIAQAEGAIGRLRGMMSGVTTQIAAGAAPVFVAIVEQLEKWIESAGGVQVAMAALGEGVAVVLRGIGFGVSAIVMALQFLVGMIQTAIAQAVRLASYTPGLSTDQRVGMQNFARDTQRGGTTNLSNAFSTQGWGAQVQAAFTQIGQRAAQLSRDVGVLRRPTDDARANFLRLAGILSRLQDSAGRFIHMPLAERFNANVNDLYQLVNAGFLSNDQGSLALASYTDELRNSLGTQGIRGPAAINPQSQEAGAAIAKLYNSPDRLDPQQRMAQLLAEAANRDVQRLQYAREIRDALVALRRV